MSTSDQSSSDKIGSMYDFLLCAGICNETVDKLRRRNDKRNFYIQNEVPFANWDKELQDLELCLDEDEFYFPDPTYTEALEEYRAKNAETYPEEMDTTDD